MSSSRGDLHSKSRPWVNGPFPFRFFSLVLVDALDNCTLFNCDDVVLLLLSLLLFLSLICDYYYFLCPALYWTGYGTDSTTACSEYVLYSMYGGAKSWSKKKSCLFFGAAEHSHPLLSPLLLVSLKRFLLSFLQSFLRTSSIESADLLCRVNNFSNNISSKLCYDSSTSSELWEAVVCT